MVALLSRWVSVLEWRHVFLVASSVLGSLVSGCRLLDLLEPEHMRRLDPIWHVTSAATDLHFWQGRPAVDDGKLFVEDGNTVLALDAATGRKLWARPVRHAPVPPPTALIARDGRVYISEVDSVLAMSQQDGHTIWNFHPDSQAVVIPAMDATTFYTGQRGIPVVYALDLGTGALRWRVDLSNGRGFEFNARVWGLSLSGDTLYATLNRDLVANGYKRSGIVVALDRRDGHELWRYETPGEFHAFEEEALVSGRFLVINDFGGDALVGFDVVAQREAWRITSDQNAPQRTVLYHGSALVAHGDDHAMAVDIETGKVRWSYNVLGSALAGGLCGSSFFVVTNDIWRFDAQSGARTGRFSPYPSITSSVASDGQRAYVTGMDGVYAFPCD